MEVDRQVAQATGALEFIKPAGVSAADDADETMSAEARDSEFQANRRYNEFWSAEYARLGVRSSADYFALVCKEHGDRPALEFVGTRARYSYAELDAASNRFARWALGSGVRPYSVTALMMRNCPMFIVAWLGLAKIGVTVACINTSLKGAHLVHALRTARATSLILGSNLYDVFHNALKDLCVTAAAADGGDLGVELVAVARDELNPRSSDTEALASSSDDSDADTPRSRANAAAAPAAAPPPPSHSPESRLREVELLEFVNASPDAIDPAVRSRIGLDDPLFYIYTSGTTGPSKAALFSHRRFIGAGLTWSRPMGLTHLDKYYVTLPLFHGNGGVVAVSAAWKAGCCVVIRSGFSVSNWWGDIIRHGCTATIYIGELWRYLYNQPPAPEERAHKLRVAAGNGLRPDIWMAVRRRFGVQRIVEHYGMTEMPAGPYMNAYGRPGACGYIPPAVRRAERHDELIRFDLDQNRPMLGKDGLCIACEDGQVGEAIFRLRQPYVGYTDPRASARRVYRDVFEKGDEWFATGDLLRRDAEGFFYFVDRMGDSFRWKGENVSTNEVSEVVAAFPGVLEANVYGVRFPPREGRPGMASVFVTVPADQFDWAAFYRHVQVLPHFAQPLFVRVRHQENDKTATFKFQKFRFEREGFDPDLVPASEPVFFRDDRPGVRSYVPLTRELHAMIMNEQFRV